MPSPTTPTPASRAGSRCSRFRLRSSPTSRAPSRRRSGSNRRRLLRRAGFGLALALTLAACGPRLARPVTGPAGALRPARGFDAALLHDDGDAASLRGAIAESLAWLATQPADRSLVFGPRAVTAAGLRVSLERLAERLAADPPTPGLADWLFREFELFESVGGDHGAVLVTGYYEPVVAAAERPTAEYAVPIFGVPEDLIEVPLEAFGERFHGERLAGRLDGRRLVPYWTRAEIVAGRLAGRGLELAWARDPLDVFFMEIQGSGTLRLPDGREIRIGHAAANGRPYRSIGRLLIDEGKLAREAVTMPALRAWLAAHPEERARVLHYNDAYVFFRRRAGPPVGSLGVPVTPGRSIATDLRLFPPGALAWLWTERPRRAADGRIAWEPLRRLVLNQDSGGAIRGTGRVDLFWGRGDDAELAAGLMKQAGRLFFLVPRR
jgi:membrane-bound lytic murein transglycosylase A